MGDTSLLHTPSHPPTPPQHSDHHTSWGKTPFGVQLEGPGSIWEAAETPAKGFGFIGMMVE